MSLIDKMDEFKNIQCEINRMIVVLKKEICEDITNNPMDGVTGIKETPLRCAVVNLSTIHDKSWSPDYYIPKSQADAVEKALDKKDGPNAIARSIIQIVDAKQAGKTRLNEKTLGIIKASELYDFALNLEAE